MGWLASVFRDDRIIFGGFGIGALAMVVMVRMMLKEWLDDAEIKPVQPKTQYITQDTEDSLKPKTLDTLLGHYNYAIRETAAKIVCDRAVNDGSTIELLLWGITRPDYDERMKNLRALAVITDPRKPKSVFPPTCYKLTPRRESSRSPQLEGVFRPRQIARAVP
jgi:hypothetical protein